MGWQDQGRQEHGWFGNGMALQQIEDNPRNGGLFGPESLDQRIGAVAYGAIASLPPALRGRAAAQYDAGNLSRLTEVMAAWSRGAKLDRASFAERFFGRAADDPVVAALHRAAQGADRAQSHAELRATADNFANTMEAVGLDHWPHFLSDAQARAHDPSTVAAVKGGNANIRLAAAGDLKCEGFSGGCQGGGNWGDTGMYGVTGRTLCTNCAVKILGIENEPPAAKALILSPFMLRGN